MTSMVCRYPGPRASRFAGGLAAALGTIGLLIGSAAEARGREEKAPAIEIRIDAVELETGLVVYNTQIPARRVRAVCAGAALADLVRLPSRGPPPRP